MFSIGALFAMEKGMSCKSGGDAEMPMLISWQVTSACFMSDSLP